MPDIFVSNNNDTPPAEKVVGAAFESISQKKEHIQKPEEITKHSHHNHPTPFTSYCEIPDNVSFMGQDKNEKVLLFLRRHPITNLTWFITAIALALAPLLLFAIPKTINFSFITLSPEHIIFFIIFYYLIVLSYVFVNFITWYYNIFLVTQKRVVDLDYSNIVYHQSAVTRLELVQDVNHSRSGFLASFFNYGDLFVQTAGTEPNLEAYAAPKPSKAAHIIANLIGNQRRKK